jgi:hypothetical protein
VEQATRNADILLKYFAAQSPQAVNYSRIVVKLTEAASEHRDKLKQDDLESRAVVVPRLFRLTPNVDDAPESQASVGSEIGQANSTEAWDLWPRQPENFPGGPLRHTSNTFSSSIPLSQHGTYNHSTLPTSAGLGQHQRNAFTGTERAGETLSENTTYEMSTEYDALVSLGDENNILGFQWGGSL